MTRWVIACTSRTAPPLAEKASTTEPALGLPLTQASSDPDA